MEDGLRKVLKFGSMGWSGVVKFVGSLSCYSRRGIVNFSFESDEKIHALVQSKVMEEVGNGSDVGEQDRRCCKSCSELF